MSSPEITANPEPLHAEALQILLKSTAMLLSTSSEDAALSGILDLANNVLAADAYAVWGNSDRHGNWRVLASRGLSSSYRKAVSAAPGSTITSLRAVEDVQVEHFLSRFQDVYAAENLRSMMIVPLLLQDGREGTLTFYWRIKRSFSSLEKDYALALGNLSSSALNTIDLHQQNDREKRRLAFLAEASTILASSLDYETTLHRVAHLAVPQVADWCTVHIVEDGSVTRLVTAHVDPAMLKLAEEYTRRYPDQGTRDQGLAAVFESGKTQLVSHITDDMLANVARDPEHLAMVRSLQITSSILVPLTAHGKVLGAIRLLAAGTGHHFDDDDVQLAEDLARRAATAIENARLHRAVIKQESELRLTHAAAHMGSWSWNLLSNQVTTSPEFNLLFGLPSNGALDTNAACSMMHPEDKDRIAAELQQILAGERDQVSLEHRVIHTDGRLAWIHSRGTIHRDASGKPESVTGISMDVTDSRQAEKALRRTEKLAAAGRLAATVAHEVNNPLEALTNLVYLAAHTQHLPEEAAVYLKTAEGELSRIAHIVGQTLGFYRESIHPRPTDLGVILSEVLDLYRSRAESRTITLKRPATPGVTVLANAGELKQVLANLISNAIDASPSGSVIDTRVQTSSDSVEIIVADHGTGISPLHLGRIFEPFFTTKSEVGTGLGLWVSKGIIDKHHGTLSVSSDTTVGQSGTIFSIQLPRNGPPPKAA